MSRLTRFAWVTLGWNVVVILLGALVRATGSGAGCGRSWPACHGQLVPALRGATAVEYTHRVASGVALLLVGILVLWVWRATDRGHPARLGAALSGVAILGEAVIGAAIVLYEWVAHNASIARAVSVPLHLVNTLLLLAALALTAFWVSGGGPIRWRGRGGERRLFLVLAAGLVLIAATGAVTALADTLFPSASVVGGIGADLSAGEHFLTRVRVVHPVVAIVTGVFVLLFARWHGLPAGGGARRAARVVMGVVVVQFVAGFLNVILLTPLWLQVVHLALADVLWIGWVWLGAELLAGTRDERVPAAASLPPGNLGAVRDVVE